MIGNQTIKMEVKLSTSKEPSEKVVEYIIPFSGIPIEEFENDDEWGLICTRSSPKPVKPIIEKPPTWGAPPNVPFRTPWDHLPIKKSRFVRVTKRDVVHPDVSSTQAVIGLGQPGPSRQVPLPTRVQQPIQQPLRMAQNMSISGGFHPGQPVTYYPVPMAQQQIMQPGPSGQYIAQTASIPGPNQILHQQPIIDPRHRQVHQQQHQRRMGRPYDQTQLMRPDGYMNGQNIQMMQQVGQMGVVAINGMGNPINPPQSSSSLIGQVVHTQQAPPRGPMGPGSMIPMQPRGTIQPMQAGNPSTLPEALAVHGINSPNITYILNQVAQLTNSNLPLIANIQQENRPLKQTSQTWPSLNQ